MELGINLIKQVFYSLLSILLPERCLSCHKGNEIICNECVLSIERAENQNQDNILALYDYNNKLVKNAIWKLKYHNRHHIGEKLGKLLYEGFIEDISDIKQYKADQVIYVIPVPLSKNKLKIRGYNQAEVIARSFCNYEHSKFIELKKDLVVKNVNTIPQAKINNRKRRLNNVKGVFKIKDEKFVKGKSFIIIDDVTTTGATFLEIIKILKKSGAKKIICFAVAH